MKATNRSDLLTYEVLLWGVHDTLDEEPKMCVALRKNGEICNKLCRHTYDNEEGVPVFCCKTHFPKTIPIGKKNCCRPKVIKDYPLQEIVNSVLIKMTSIHNENKPVFDTLENILIELQPTFNPSMKLISHVVYGKLAELYLNSSCVIKFVRASQKLRAYTGEPIHCDLKGKYNQRKWLSKKYCSYFLENKFSHEQQEKWLPYFREKGTADESDTFLMCINHLFGLKKNKQVSPCVDDKTDFEADSHQKL